MRSEARKVVKADTRCPHNQGRPLRVFGAGRHAVAKNLLEQGRTPEARQTQPVPGSKPGLRGGVRSQDGKLRPRFKARSRAPRRRCRRLFRRCKCAGRRKIKNKGAEKMRIYHATKNFSVAEVINGRRYKEIFGGI